MGGLLAMTSAVVVAACGAGSNAMVGSTRGDAQVTLDGSSTVFPISEAVAEEFRKVSPSIRLTVGISGTGGGFQKFCHGETDITEASRPITTIEAHACGRSGVEFIELPIAYDGIAIVAHPRATWVDHITVAELKRIWEPSAQGTITKWSQVRSGWPDRELHLFGAGFDSGTYDYFTLAVTGTTKSSRGDFTSSENDNVLVQGVSSDEGALGFVPFSYYETNRDRLKLLPVDDGEPANGEGPVLPTPDAIRTGAYHPLSRLVFIYVSKAAAERPTVQRFVEFYLAEVETLAREVHYVGLGPRVYEELGKRFARRTTGSVFTGTAVVGVTIDQLLSNERAR
ncbi:MAG: PstS family phosphate ABC transporter substrate-binding protein [Vicinamibacterales bacterium]